ncbi:MAG: two component transcriptional regulator, LuxR family [Frankiales bacterium]|nr:two component transcriptional regulator, LuxR family [Frankiales bacterium]
MIRVVLVDDQTIVRTGLARIFGAEDGFEVVAECGDGLEAVVAAAAVRPDLVLMDIRMPRMDGLEATRILTAEAGAPPVLALTTFDEDDILWGSIEAGAQGFVLKDAGADDLLAAARVVAGGGAWFDPAVTPRLMRAYRRAVAPSQREAARLTRLTGREHEVLRLLARGRLNSEIAAELNVSQGTVKSHVSAIFEKLAVRDRAAAIVFAFDQGIVTPGEH